MLGGQSLRQTAKGRDNGVRVLDLDNDGYMDVVIGNSKKRETLIWEPKTSSWRSSKTPILVVGDRMSVKPKRVLDFGRAARNTR